MELGPRPSGRRPLAQINVTPFVDVMLVLLIIFMVTAPMMETGIDVNLPEVSDAPPLEKANEPLIVTLKKDGSLALTGKRVRDLKHLTSVLSEALPKQADKGVFLEADRDVPYGEVTRVMAALRGGGVEKLGMITRPHDHK
ncbi:MAG: protein TolR [Desulfuromonas sp.]|nr:MAG: protein TolR [Desulfuromonas sp.]